MQSDSEASMDAVANNQVLPNESASQVSEAITLGKRKRTSPIYQHFTQSEDGSYYVCKIKNCGAKYKYTNPSTTNMMDHYKSKHPHVVIDPSRQTKTRMLDSKFESNDNQIPPWARQWNKPRFRYLLIKWIVADNQAFSVTESPEFVELLRFLKREAVPPGGDTIKIEIEKLFGIVKMKVEDMFRDLDAPVALSQDAWSSQSMDAFLGIYAHYIDKDWSLQALPLDFVPLKGSHSGQNLAQSFISAAGQSKIRSLSAIVCDNASNNNTFMATLEKMSLEQDLDQLEGFDADSNRQRCLPHTVNLICKAFLKTLFGKDKNEDDESSSEEETEGEDLNLPVLGIKDVADFDMVKDDNPLNKLRKLIKKIRGSTQMMEKFDHICASNKIPTLKVIIDVSTRWNSTFDMSVRAMNLKGALIDICNHVKKFKKYELSETEWRYIGVISQVMEPLKEVTKLFSADSVSTLGQLIPVFNALMDHFEDLGDSSEDERIKKACRAAADKAIEYYRKNNLSNNCLFAMTLDPRVKTDWLNYADEDGEGLADAAVRKLLDTLKLEVQVAAVVENQNQTRSNWNLPAWQVAANNARKNATTDRDSLENELTNYLREESVAVPFDVRYDPCTWWRDNHYRYPHLAKLAKKYLAIPAGSVSVERWFSAARDLLGIRRASLSPATIRMCMLLRVWLRSMGPEMDRAVMLQFCGQGE
jgi:hypothetical protein